jgi:hypothetical protein
MADFIPVKMQLNSDPEIKLRRHLKGRILALEDGLHELHESKITKWRQAYEAKPREEVREFPFYHSSNLVVPIIAIFSDTLQARVMSALLKTRPPWIVKMIGTHPDMSDHLSGALEEFLEYVGIEPEELDLYRVYHEWTGDTIKYGTSVVKAPHEVRYMHEVIGVPGDGSGSIEPEFIQSLEYEGPRPEKIAFEDFLIPPASKTLETADIIIHKRVMTRNELGERRFFKIYEPSRVDMIWHKPDRSGPSYTQTMKEDSQGAHTTAGYGYAEWDIYECWLKWLTPDGKWRPRIVATYHKNSDTLLRTIYDTSKLLPYALARLFYRDDSIYGYGFCETMWSFQEELSEEHNGRLDNRTIANTRLWRVDPNSKLHAGYRIYPSALVPAEKDEIEPLQMGDISSQTIDDERFSIELAERRAGISPPMQGAGAGQQGKRGIYTAQGTLAVMQEGNRRTDLNISDMRYSHTRLGRILLSDYAHNKVRKSLLDVFGEKAPLIEEALQAVKDNKLGLPIYSSTASVNKEVEKQSKMMLIGLMKQHYMGIAQMIAQISQPTIPEDVKKYLSDVIQASNIVMKSTLKDFDMEDVDLLVPEVEEHAPTANAAGAPPAGGQPGAQPPGQAPPQGQPGSNVLGFPGGGGVSNVPSGNAGR